MTDSAKDELEDLQKRKEELMSKLEAVRRDRNTLEEGIRILKEKAAVRELEQKLREEQNAFSKLSFEKKELEERLNQPSRFSTIKVAVEKNKTELEHKKDTSETEAKEQPQTEEPEQPETKETEEIGPIWKEHEEESEREESESDKEPEQESKKKLRFF